MKRSIALFLALCISLSAAVIVVAADTVSAVSANEATVTVGGTAYVTLNAENFQNIAALDIYVYYDPTVMTVSSTINGSLLSGAQSSVNTSESGKLTLSLMSLDGISGSGPLLTICFTTSNDCAEGTYPVTVAIGRAYDGNLSEATIKGKNGSVTVYKPIVNEHFHVYSNVDKSTLQKDDVLTVSVENSSRRSFVSAEFSVEFDRDTFVFESISFDPEMVGEGAVYSVNSSISGQVRIAYANDEAVDPYHLFSVKLKVIADKDERVTVKTSASNVYRDDLSLYLPWSDNSYVNLVKTPDAVDHPNSYFKSDMLVVGKTAETEFLLEAGSNVAAADFTLVYDKSVLRCVGVTAADGIGDKGGMIVVNDNFANGTIRFSYVNMSAYDEEDLPLVKVTWEVIKSPNEHFVLASSAVGVVDADQQPITLEHIAYSDCIYVATVKEPTCVKEGSVSYECECGETYGPVVLPTISEEECTHYNVRFLDYDKSVISEQSYHYGDTVEVPESPTREADKTYTYTFKGWDKEITDCVGDAVYTATYSSEYIEYTVTFKDYDGDVISSKVYHYGDSVVAPADPTRKADKTYTYNFKGWDNDVVDCIGDAVYTATYSSEYVEYTVIFKDYDGKIISSKTYHYGDTVEVPEAPTREADKTYTYTFKGWDKEIINCAGDAVYTATYSSEYIEYTVIFKDYNGDVISSKVYHYGDTVTIPESPTREADKTYTYNFKGWDKEITDCVGDAVYTATYSSEYIEYTVTFKDYDGKIISSKTYHYGDTVEVPESPTREADKTYTYTFKGWDKEIINCVGDAVYTATYNSEYIEYTVTFKDYNGDVISSDTYHYGDTVEVPESPTREADETYTYTFIGWGKEVINCVGDAVYTATYSSEYIEYTVTFKDYNGDVISSDTYHYGDTVEVPKSPTREADETYTYTFIGWGNDVVDCIGDAVYTATYNSEYIEYTVVFKDYDGMIISSKVYHYGDSVVAPADPTREADKTYTYTFKGWDKEITNCVSDAVYTATYNSEYIEYTVAFKDYDGTVLSEEVYHYGDKIIAPELPEKAPDDTYTYTAQWDNGYSGICVCDAVYTVEFVPVYIEYTVVFKDYDGKIISSKAYHYGEAVTEPDAPTRASDKEYHYSFIGWNEAVVACNGNAEYVAQYETKAVELTHIAILKKPDKYTYSEGEPLDLKGLVVYAYYDNGLSEEITDYTVNGSTEAPGTVKVTVDFNGKTDFFEIIVEEEPKYLLGDINGNGKVEKYDYILVKRYVLKTVSLTDLQQQAADVNRNGKIDKYDYILIKRHVLGTFVIG